MGIGESGNHKDELKSGQRGERGTPHRHKEDECLRVICTMRENILQSINACQDGAVGRGI